MECTVCLIAEKTGPWQLTVKLSITEEMVKPTSPNLMRKLYCHSHQRAVMFHMFRRKSKVRSCWHLEISRVICRFGIRISPKRSLNRDIAGNCQWIHLVEKLVTSDPKGKYYTGKTRISIFVSVLITMLIWYHQFMPVCRTVNMSFDCRIQDTWKFIIFIDNVIKAVFIYPIVIISIKI